MAEQNRLDHRGSMDAVPVFGSPSQILTHAGLRLAGYSPHEIRSALRSGSLAPLVRGSYAAGQVYRHSSAELRHLQTARARALGSTAVVVSHVSAAVHHGLPVPPESLAVVHVTRSGRGGSRRSAAVEQHAAMLAAGDVVTSGGVNVTSLPRTLVDLARSVSFESAVIAADVALRQHPDVVDDVAEVLARTRRLPAAGRARRALMFADGRADSPGESRTRVVLDRAGLPAAELQLEIFDDRGSFVAKVDLAMRECGVVSEFDGMVKYGDLMRGRLSPQQVLAKEKRREDALRELGWLVIRVTWMELADPTRLVGRVSSALTRGQRVVDLGGISGTSRPTAPIRVRAG